jgi:Fe-S-cluster containining protein
LPVPYCLSLYSGFLCRRSGACCTSGWPIHVEAGRLPALSEALAAGRLPCSLGPADEGSPFVEEIGLPPGAGAVLRTGASGTCPFYEGGSGLCAVQRVLGHDALPSACQHFPRRCLVEHDRIAVSLSHYCPTVARTVFDADARLEIVEAPPRLAGRIALEGLDARQALPPLLRPGLLTDREGYRAWERAVLESLAAPVTPESALAEISSLTESVRLWRPRDGALREAVDAARGGVERRGDGCPRLAASAAERAADHDEVRASVPPGFAAASPPDRLDDADARWVAARWPLFSRPLRHFLAAHAFGNWTAYHGTGLRTVVRGLETALAVVRVEVARLCADAARPLDEPLLTEAMRAADLLLVHLADPKALAERLSRVEQEQ